MNTTDQFYFPDKPACNYLATFNTTRSKPAASQYSSDHL